MMKESCLFLLRHRGNYALGVKEQLIFPEIEYDKIDKIRGMDIVCLLYTSRCV